MQPVRDTSWYMFLTTQTLLPLWIILIMTRTLLGSCVMTTTPNMCLWVAITASSIWIVCFVNPSCNIHSNKVTKTTTRTPCTSRDIPANRLTYATPTCTQFPIAIRSSKVITTKKWRMIEIQPSPIMITSCQDMSLVTITMCTRFSQISSYAMLVTRSNILQDSWSFPIRDKKMKFPFVIIAHSNKKGMTAQNRISSSSPSSGIIPTSPCVCERSKWFLGGIIVRNTMIRQPIVTILTTT